MPLVVRTWNVFHGNASPPERRAFLREMVELVTADAPDVVCLQELPVWATERLESWSGMQAVVDVTERPVLPAKLSRLVTDIHHGLFRSAVTGQANAILLSPMLAVREHWRLVLNPRRFRREHLVYGRSVLRAWARNRRVCQAARLRVGQRTVLVANLHLTSLAGDERPATAELERAARWLDSLVQAGEPTILCGDFNTNPQLVQHGFSRAGPGIDHVLVRGESASDPHVWAAERRRLDGRLLSDHAPVEVAVG